MALNRPLLAITMGDPAGVGPEVIVKCLAHPEVWAFCRPLVVGDARWMAEAARIVSADRPVRAVHAVADAGTGESLDLLDLANVDAARLARGCVSAEGGRAAYEYVQEAVRLALQGSAAAVVTAPINKEALHAAGYRYAGHTELLADLCGVTGTVMMLVTDRLRVSHVSTHVALREAPERVTVERVLHVVRLTHAALVRLGISAPRLAVAGLNPHAGEGGLFGDEDREIIGPAVTAAQQGGFDARGPFPPDSIFFRASRGEFDAIVAMYHDQGHIAIKMLGFYEGINVTLGLPIIRTSVDHGTAFDIVGTGRADEYSMVAALRLAARLALGNPKGE
ncbi:MAG: 4-hydroxythreonine-4-phosphate dehydrogenase PdxA [Candidatus Methylomirabilia bacterium]